jgi:hypothetical protein
MNAGELLELQGMDRFRKGPYLSQAALSHWLRRCCRVTVYLERGDSHPAFSAVDAAELLNQ